MKKEEQNILRIRIAANILYRINRKFTIEYYYWCDKIALVLNIIK